MHADEQTGQGKLKHNMYSESTNRRIKEEESLKWKTGKETWTMKPNARGEALRYNQPGQRQTVMDKYDSGTASYPIFTLPRIL